MNHLLEKYYNLKKSRFISDVTIVAGGTAIAQAIMIAFSPMITRIYGPEAFGILGVFVAMTSLITPLASLAYTVAIVIPASDKDARSLVKLSLFIAICVASLLMIVLGVFHHPIANGFGLHTSSLYLLLLPALVLLTAAEQAFSEWLIRKKQFRSISVATVAHAATVNISKTGIGLIIATAPVLIILNTIGQVFHVVLLWFQAKSSLLHNVRQEYVANAGQVSSIKTVAHKYRDYPLYRSPQVLIHNVSQNIPVLMLAAFFGPVPAGFYALTRRVLKLPSVLISVSAGKVFLPHIAEAAQRGTKLRPLIVKATGGLALVGTVPYGLIIAFGPWLFGFIFGAEWSIAGEYARWLSLWLYIIFISVPSTHAIPLLGLQGHFLIYEVIMIIVTSGALAFGALVMESDIIDVALFSISGAILNIILLIWVFINSKDRLRENL